MTTYGTVIDVPNPQLKLKPGMTANVKVEIAKRTDVLRVPNAALRFRPTTEVFAALNQPVPPEARPARRAAAAARRVGPRRRSGAATGATPPAAPAAPSTAASGSRTAPSRCSDARRPAATVAPPARRQARRRTQRAADAVGGAAAQGGGEGRAVRSGAHDGTLQGDVARRAEAVHRAHEGSRPGHQRVRDGRQRPKPRGVASAGRSTAAAAPAQTIDALFAPLPPSNRAAARGCS